MEDNAYIGELLVVVVYLIAGVRLLRLAQCTGELPERLLGATFLFLPTLFWIMYAQSSAFSLALLTTAFVCLRRGRDLPAGLVLGCLAYKPQLALALGCVLLVKGRGRALLGAAASVCGWVALSIAASPEATLAYLELSPELADLMRREGYPIWGLSSFYGFGVLLFDGLWPAATVPVASALSAAALLALTLVWRRVEWLPGSEGWDLMMAGTLAWGLLVSPHLYHYDLMLLLLPLLVVAARLRAWPDSPQRRVLLAWTALVCIASGLGHYVTRLQLELAAHAGWPALALQTSVLAVAVWGALLVSATRASGAQVPVASTESGDVLHSFCRSSRKAGCGAHPAGEQS